MQTVDQNHFYNKISSDLQVKGGNPLKIGNLLLPRGKLTFIFSLNTLSDYIQKKLNLIYIIFYLV